MNKVVIPAAVVAIIVAVAVVAYTLGVSTSQQTTPVTPKVPTTSIPTERETPSNAPTVEPKNVMSRSAVTENIEAAVKSKNYAALEGYMADNVSVILYATECCGILAKDKATAQMSYLTGGTPPWDFSTSSTIAQKLIAADPANFAGRMIGVASNGMVVSFNLGSDNKIDKIFISADYKLIAP